MQSGCAKPLTRESSEADGRYRNIGYRIETTSTIALLSAVRKLLKNYVIEMIKSQLK